MEDSGDTPPPQDVKHPVKRKWLRKSLQAAGVIAGGAAVIATQTEPGKKVINAVGNALTPKDQGQSDYAAQEQRRNERSGMEAAGVLPRLAPTASPSPMSLEERKIRDNNAKNPNMVRPTPATPSKR